MLAPSDIYAAAEFYRVCHRTVQRWRSAGVDVGDPVEVAQHLAQQRNPADAPLSAVIDALDEELSTDDI